MVAADLNNKKIAIDIRAAGAADLDAIVALDAAQTGAAKTRYWTKVLEGCTSRSQGDRRYFLVGRTPDGELLGFIVGEIRAWEFGSPPCGWVLALNVTPGHRERGIGTMLFDALCAELKRDGVTTIRTMVLASDRVNLSFFRGEGLAAGPYIELERQLD
ncbi:MAG: GNAT family N-acetyltransferase [Woeseia sp.]